MTDQSPASLSREEHEGQRGAGTPDFKMARTGAVLAPNADRRQVPTTKRTLLEQLVQGAAQGATARVDLRPRLPDVVVRILERFGGDDWAVAEERPAVRATVALVEDFDQVREDIRGLQRHERVQRWK